MVGEPINRIRPGRTEGPLDRRHRGLETIPGRVIEFAAIGPRDNEPRTECRFTPLDATRGSLLAALLGREGAPQETLPLESARLVLTALAHRGQVLHRAPAFQMAAHLQRHACD